MTIDTIPPTIFAPSTISATTTSLKGRKRLLPHPREGQP